MKNSRNGKNETFRLNKFIAQSGLCSRRKADELIESGCVRVNGKTVNELGMLVSAGDKIEVNGSQIKKVQYTYIKYYKPAGYITTMDDEKGRKTIYDLLPAELKKLKPAGRLDKDSTGLIILTDDGDLIYRLTHPSIKIPKVYRVVARGKMNLEHLKQMAEGIEIEKGKIAYADAMIVEYEGKDTVLQVTLYQGLNRQIRKMLDFLGYPVISLKRVTHGTINIQGMKKAKTLNTLFLLDEIDKLGADWRGDPSSALLEVLDPEQNSTFNDHYLEIDYNLSDVMFVTTANTLKMPRPLLDRMEVIQLSGYTEDEKVEIAKRHLIAKQMKAAGLTEKEFKVTEDAIRSLIRLYTREAGVRNLEREIANLTRKAVKEIMMDNQKTVEITQENLSKYAGVPRFNFGVAEQEDQVGVTTGLAWTEVGGEILSIEAVTMPGKGNIILTGQLGDVMKESVEAARSYIRSHHVAFGIPSSLFEKNDLHVHVPEGATPKDGPSAGITMCTSLVSALTGIPVRKDIAMTGEITLRGRVLPIGGLKEKLLAALRAGLKTVLIPAENEKDLEEIPKNVKEGLQIIPVSYVKEVLEKALTKPLTPLPNDLSSCNVPETENTISVN